LAEHRYLLWYQREGKGEETQRERGERTEDGKELKMGEAWMGKARSRWEKKGTGRDEQGGVHMNKQVG